MPLTTESWAARMSSPAFSGVPPANGGWGSYSNASCSVRATVSPLICRDQRQREVDPGSHPAAGHAVAVVTVRALFGPAPNRARCWCQAQWVVARSPLAEPAAPRTSEPVQTLVTHAACASDGADPRHRRVILPSLRKRRSRQECKDVCAGTSSKVAVGIIANRRRSSPAADLARPDPSGAGHPRQELGRARSDRAGSGRGTEGSYPGHGTAFGGSTVPCIPERQLA